MEKVQLQSIGREVSFFFWWALQLYCCLQTYYCYRSCVWWCSCRSERGLLGWFHSPAVHRCWVWHAGSSAKLVPHKLLFRTPLVCNYCHHQQHISFILFTLCSRELTETLNIDLPDAHAYFRKSNQEKDLKMYV